MTEAEFEALVHRLEERARHAPRAYRMRVVGLAALAQAVVGAGLLVLAAGCGGLVVLAALGHGRALLLQVGVAVAALAVLVGRALWVGLEAPRGFRLKKEAAPRLADCVEQLRRGLAAPPVHEILVTADFVAALAQRPRLGLLGWQKNTLILGLPFLLTCSEEQFRAAVGHELAHLSGRRGRLNAWIYRARAAWSRIAEQLQRERHWASSVFRRFFRWHAPLFEAWSFVLARRHELDADAAAAGVTSPEDVRDALMALHVHGRFLQERFWPRVQAGAQHTPSPEENPFADLPQLLAEVDEQDARAWMEAALAEETTVSDTHPCLRDRLAALGMEPALPGSPEVSAGESLLGPALPGLSARIGEQWCFDAALWWNERYEHTESMRKRRGELESAARTGLISPDEAWECAELSEELDGAAAALPLYRDLVEEDLEDPRPRFALGRLLLASGDESGLVHLDGAAELDDEAVLPASKLAADFLARRGRSAEAKVYAERAAQHRERIEREHEERQTLPFDARYLAHDLADEELEGFRERLARWPLRRAWLVRKELTVRPEPPLFVLGAEWRLPRWRVASDRLRTPLQDELARELELPGEGFVLVLNGRERRFWRMFTGVQGSQVVPGR